MQLHAFDLDALESRRNHLRNLDVRLKADEQMNLRLLRHHRKVLDGNRRLIAEVGAREFRFGVAEQHSWNRNFERAFDPLIRADIRDGNFDGAEPLAADPLINFRHVVNQIFNNFVVQVDRDDPFGAVRVEVKRQGELLVPHRVGSFS